MKNFITGIILFSVAFFASSEITIVSEVLVGKSQNEYHSSISEDNYSSSLNANSYALRLGVKLTENVSFELGRHDHGSTINSGTVSLPSFLNQDPNPNPNPNPDSYTTFETRIPLDVTSIRFGVKGEVELFTNVAVNARLGLAHWKYGSYNPYQLARFSAFYNSGESGNDIYYSVGIDYKFTENFYLGLEYSLLNINESSGDESSVDASYKHKITDLSLIAGWIF